MELKVIVDLTHPGENIFTTKLYKFPVHTVLIVYTKIMLFCCDSEL